MADTVNLVKICVGAERVEDLIAWQTSPRCRKSGGRPVHVTRMFPKRAEEVLNGGSLYWVFKGMILARQSIVALDEVQGHDGILRCGIVMDPNVVRTEAVPRRPFQGWRYLPVDEAPRDLRKPRASEANLPPELMTALAEIGVR